MRYRLLLACAMIALSAPVLAQSSATRSAGQNVAAAAQGDLDAQTFVEKAKVSNMFEIEPSELALDKAQDQEVRQVAEMMVNDHERAGKKLESTLRSAVAAVEVPDEMDAQHQQMLAELEAAEGEQFDRLYVQMQTKAHEQAVALFEAYAKNGDNQALQLASSTLPTLQQHYQQIKEVKPGS